MTISKSQGQAFDKALCQELTCKMTYQLKSKKIRSREKIWVDSVPKMSFDILSCKVDKKKKLFLNEIEMTM